MPLTIINKSLSTELSTTEGYLSHDQTALTTCQRECTARLGMTIQLEQEAYLSEHPEVTALLELFVTQIVGCPTRKLILKAAAEFFLRPIKELDADVRKRLGLPPEAPYLESNRKPFTYKDENLERDLRAIINKHYPPEPWRVPISTVPTPDTASSSFISIRTSLTTLPTPEPIPTPEPTLSETFFAIVSNTVDKAIFLHVDDNTLHYDTAYVEIMKAVEDAMELTVVEIKEDIAELYFNAFHMFELDIIEKERIAAEIAWEKRMRKKLKKTLRRLHNFKGYETPPSSRDEISSHKSYEKPPPRPCKCHPQWHYNRYEKDRFGIYLPREVGFSDANVTVTPAISLESIPNEGEDYKADTKSVISKSALSTKSGASKKVKVNV